MYQILLLISLIGQLLKFIELEELFLIFVQELNLWLIRRDTRLLPGHDICIGLLNRRLVRLTLVGHSTNELLDTAAFIHNATA